VLPFDPFSAGKALLTGTDDNRADDVERAIRSLSKAMDALEKHDAPVDPAMHDRVRAWLAIAYDERVLGSREENIQRILVHTDSLDLDDDEDAELRLRAKVLRGVAFRDRSAAGGLGRADRDIAISFFTGALAEISRKTMPDLWARAQFELGDTLLGASDWAGARKHLEKALTGYDRRRHPRHFGAIHRRLGDYHKRVAFESGSVDAVAKALGHYSIALASLNPDQSPVEWADVHVGLSILVGAGGRSDDLVVEHLATALDALSRPEHVPQRVAVLDGLARFLLHRQRWHDARPRLAEAMKLALDGIELAHTVAGRRAAVADISRLANELAYCHYRLGDLDEALLTLESGRVVLLGDVLRQDRRDEDTDLAGIHRQIRKLEIQQYGGMTSIEDSDRLAALRALVPAERRERPTVAQLAPANPGTALVVPLIGAVGSALFVLTSGAERVAAENVIDLPDLEPERLERWLAHDWLPAYLDRNGWPDTLARVCGELWDAAIGRLWDRVRELGIARLTVIPVGGLQFLPVHAAARTIGGRVRYLIDDVTVTYTPSAYVMAVSEGRARDRVVTGPALVAGAGRYETMPNLPNVPGELRMVGAALGAEPLLDEEASRDRVLAGAAGAHVVHLACHGAAWALGGPWFKMDWSPPAVLHLGDGGLSFQDILGLDLAAARLVCLSACDTGMVDASLSWDEFEGLANVFLQAGAAAVVSSLWAVEDRSTALLMQRFYENLTDRSDDPATALRAAQLWLRDGTRAVFAEVYERLIDRGLGLFQDDWADMLLGGDAEERPYAHPRYWAPFTLTGG
jgi:CHAT domain-containing protein/tetratricopeptide (TPR) repeat protein